MYQEVSVFSMCMALKYLGNSLFGHQLVHLHPRAPGSAITVTQPTAILQVFMQAMIIFQSYDIQA